MKTLRNVLLVNAVSSGATGLGLAVMPGLFAELFNVSLRAPFMGTGLFLMAYAILVFIESRKKEMNVSWIRFIIMMDGLWVVCSLIVIIVAANLFPISMLGNFMIGAVALWVALMGYLQYVGLKRIMITQ